MAYDEKLGMRVRAAVDGLGDVTEKKMFGGLAFLLGGKMFCGLIGDELMVRVGPDAHEGALAEAHVRPMDFTGRPMAGYVYVAAPGLKTEAALAKWVKRGASFVATLPEKAAKKKTPKTPARTTPKRRG